MLILPELTVHSDNYCYSSQYYTVYPLTCINKLLSRFYEIKYPMSLSKTRQNGRLFTGQGFSGFKRDKSQQTKKYRISIITKILENETSLQKRRNKFRGKKMSAPKGKCYGGDAN